MRSRNCWQKFTDSLKRNWHYSFKPLISQLKLASKCQSLQKTGWAFAGRSSGTKFTATSEDVMLKLILRIGLLSGICLAGAERAGAADEKRVKVAVEKAIAFLKSHYNGPGFIAGTPPTLPRAGDDGAMALCGIALLEAKVALDDPVILDIAQRVRDAAIDQSRTYSLALELILLDKLKQESDKLLIQSIAARLILGQNWAGGWTYVCPALDKGLKDRLKKQASERGAKGSSKPPEGETDVDHRPEIDPDIDQMLKTPPSSPAPPPREDRRNSREDDNSNTQFALIALWSARRHGMPVEKSLRLVEKRFRETQTKGGWAYVPGPGFDPTASMTCAGLLGLAVSSGMDGERVLKSRGPLGADEKPKSKPRGDSAPAVRNPLKDPAIQAGIAYLTNEMNTNPNGDPRPGAPGGGRRPSNDDLRNNLYFLWSLERVSVVFGITRFGNRDWYDWGANSLLVRQGQDGSWVASYGLGPDTSFGLMFLVHANIVRDLTHVLKASAPPDEIRPPKASGSES